MNTLSWFLYLADIANKLYVNIGPSLVITFLFIIVPLFVCSVVYSEERDYENGEYKRVRVYPARHVGAHLKWIVPLWVIFFVLGMIIPSKDTLLMIAASQVGEQVIQLQQVQELGGEAGALATDTIRMLREQVSAGLENLPAEAPPVE